MMFDDTTPYLNDDNSSLHRAKMFGIYRITPAEAGQRDSKIAMREALSALNKVPPTSKPKS